MLENVQKQAEDAEKYIVKGSEVKVTTPYNLYYSEIEFENNCIYVELDSFQNVYLGNLSFGSLKTSNSNYGSATREWINNLKKKSNQISGMSETIRYKFFRRCFDKLSKLETHIEEN